MVLPLSKPRKFAHAHLPQALDWLDVHFWTPTLASLTSTPARQPAKRASFLALPPAPFSAPDASAALRTALVSYRALAKSVVRDESQRGKLKGPMLKLCREIETLARDLELGAHVVGGWGVRRAREEEEEEMLDDEDEEAQAAEEEAETSWSALVQALLEPGALVPLSKA